MVDDEVDRRGRARQRQLIAPERLVRQTHAHGIELHPRAVAALHHGQHHRPLIEAEHLGVDLVVAGIDVADNAHPVFHRVNQGSHLARNFAALNGQTRHDEAGAVARAVVGDEGFAEIGLAGHVVESGFEQLVGQQAVVGAPGGVAGHGGLALFLLVKKGEVVGSGGGLVGREADGVDFEVAEHRPARKQAAHAERGAHGAGAQQRVGERDGGHHADAAQLHGVQVDEAGRTQRERDRKLALDLGFYLHQGPFEQLLALDEEQAEAGQQQHREDAQANANSFLDCWSDAHESGRKRKAGAGPARIGPNPPPRE